MRERAQQGLLHQIVGAVDVAAQRNGESAQARHRSEHLVAYGRIELHATPSSCSLRRRTKSAIWGGTPSLTTWSYMARNCWPMRAWASRPSRTSVLRGPIGLPMASRVSGISSFAADSTFTVLRLFISVTSPIPPVAPQNRVAYQPIRHQRAVFGLVPPPGTVFGNLVCPGTF